MATTAPLLIVEDDAGLRRQLRWALSEDFEIFEAGDREQGLALLRREEPNAVLLDLGLPPDKDGTSEGFAALDEILSLRPSTKVIVASGNDDQDNAIRAVGLGAYDFCAKPVDIDVLRLIIERSLHVAKLEMENRRLAESRSHAPFDGLIAASPEMMKVVRAIERIAPSEVSVLLTGESGTGKEVLARALHDTGPRAKGPFVAINCAAIPETLLESELFGHERGAFTGAAKQTKGKIEHAQSGTLFLDEIGDMPLSLQSKLLRFLQEKKIERVGGRQTIDVDVRVVSATNRDLGQLIESGDFREDLYYRLNEVSIRIPPLRERTGDAVLLANYFIRQLRPRFNRNIKGLSHDAAAAVAAYPWPGNVRELENRIKRAMVLAENKLLGRDDLDLEAVDGMEVRLPTLKEARETAEVNTIRQALALTKYNVSAAAKLLGVSRPGLYHLIKSLDLRIQTGDSS